MAIIQSAVARAVRLVPRVDCFDSTLAIATTATLHFLVAVLVLFFSRVALERSDAILSDTPGSSSDSEFRLRFVTASPQNAEIGATEEPALVSPDAAAERDATRDMSSESAGAYSNALRASSAHPDSVEMDGDRRDSAQVSISEADAVKPEDAALRRIYLAELRAAILKQWNRPEGSIRECSIELQLRPGGQVAGAKLGRCTLIADARNQLEAAALLAQPLPYQGYETVFSELVELQLEP